ncbi:Retrovirus-related Pol polyprotein, partial [Mucuna pruriens]
MLHDKHILKLAIGLHGVYVDSFDACLENLSKVLTRCIDTNLVFNFEKCHFMVTEGIVLGHLVSNRGIKVDKSKIDIITSLPNPAFVLEVRSFLGHKIYQEFHQDCPATIQTATKDVEFKFDQPYIEAFQELKNQLTSAPILQEPNWELPFELMCDASNSTLRVAIGQRVGFGKPVHVISYASRTMDPTQLNYTTTEKELLAIVFALCKFLSYLLGSKIVVFSDHVALRFLLKKPNAKPRLIRIERENDSMPIKDNFLDEQLLHIYMPTQWFANICNFVAASQFPPKASRLYKERLQSDAKYYI